MGKFHYYSISKGSHLNTPIETLTNFKLWNGVFIIVIYIETLCIGKCPISQGSRNLVHYIVVDITIGSYQFILKSEHYSFIFYFLMVPWTNFYDYKISSSYELYQTRCKGRSLFQHTMIICQGGHLKLSDLFY